MELLTVEEAAARLGVSVASVRRKAASGELTAEKSGRQWLIHGDRLPKGSRRRAPAMASDGLDVRTAIRHVRSKDIAELWVPDVLRYEDRLSVEEALISEVVARLQGADLDPAVEIPIAKTPFFTRGAALLGLEDRVAYQAVVGSLSVRIDSAIPPQVWSARLSKDPKWFLEKGQKAWRKFLDAVRADIIAGNTWMVKTDLTAYFDHIPHRLLLEEISALNPDPKTVEVLRRMLRAWATVPDMGLPQGPNASRLLGNLYLLPVDRTMLSEGYKYHRYMDDIRIVAPSKTEAVRAMRLLERECRRRGLILSTAKTELLQGAAALSDGTDPERDAAQYLFDAASVDSSRKALKAILRKALHENGHISVSSVRFSLWRLARLRESSIIPALFARLEDLAPVASVVAAYLRFFVQRERVVTGLADFLEDRDRAHSAHLVTWMFATMLEREGMLPERWTGLAGEYFRDRNLPSYLRAVAVVVFVRSGRPSDVTWLKAQLAQEYDPVVLRGMIVGLHWAGALDKATERAVRSRSPFLTETLQYLSGRDRLPSLVFREGSLLLR